jgi:hypothetical protein
VRTRTEAGSASGPGPTNASKPAADVEPVTVSPEASPPPQPETRPSPAGIVDRLREVALPHLELLARRLRKARHDAVVQNALGNFEPAIRFHFRPWQGPFNKSPRGRAIILEMAAAEQGGKEQLVARYRLDPDHPSPTLELCAPAGKLDTGWVDRCLLDFLERALDLA